MHACIGMYVCKLMYMNETSTEFRGCSARERDFERTVNGIFRMPRAGARFSLRFSGRSARERDFERQINNVFKECSAQERASLQNYQDAPHGNAILNEQTMKF